MEEVKNLRTRVMSGLTAAGIALAGYAVTSPINVYAEKVSKYGVTIDQETGEEYNTVIVEEGDTASKISSRIVHYFIENKEVPADDKAMFNEDYDTRSRFWPVVVYMNTEPGCKYHSKVGEKFIFPKTYDELVEMNTYLRKSGWLARYVQNNHVYPQEKVYSVPREKTRRLVQGIYREMYNDPNLIVDDETLDAYLKAHNSKNSKFVYKKNSRLDKEELFILTEWIPTMDELNDYKEDQPKRRTRR